MTRLSAVSLLAVLGVVFSARQQQQSNAGVQKVIQMLNDMSATTKKEKADEEVAFSTFSMWCKQESASLKSEIAKNAENIELLGSSIVKLTSDVKTLGDNIAQLNADAEKWGADSKAATAQREKDHAAFVEESRDYAESVDALDRAITVLQKQDYDRTGAETALLQVSANNRVPEQVKSIVAAFIGMMDSPDLGSYNAPEANAYEFQSSSIVDLLKRLRGEFSEKLGECQKEEMNSKHAYDMIIQDLTDSIEYANKDIDEKTIEKERKSEKAAQDKKQLAATVDMKAANEKTLVETTAECAQKKLSFQEKQQLRADEIEAIAKAVEILSSPDVSGNAEKHLALAQARKQPATALVATSSLRTGGIRHRVRDFLTDAGVRLHSQGLTLLAEKIAADPFAKVKHLIDSMITRLLEEANADADHEGYCDKEMGKSKITRNKLSEEIDSLTAAAEEGKSTIMTLAEDIKQLTKEVADIDAALAEATDMRIAEKATNAETVKDAKAAQAAVEAATKVLADFYKQAGEATGFLQVSAEKAPYGVQSIIKMHSEEWDQLANPNFKGTVDTGHKAGMQTFGNDGPGTQGETYKGQQAEAGGVLALLEVILSDFANVQADTEAEEAASQKEYGGFMVDSKKNKAVKERKIEMDNADKAAAETRLREDIADLKSTQDQLLAADRYHEKLVPQCIDQGQTFEERTAARAAEIASLKEALKILSSEDITTSAL
jgi:hypothetical protein